MNILVASGYSANCEVYEIVPERDMRLGECFVVTEGLEALFEKYPKAREIYENSGSRVYIKE